jgi:mono/diheme cytochrome c family protein
VLDAPLRQAAALPISYVINIFALGSTTSHGTIYVVACTLLADYTMKGRSVTKAFLALVLSLVICWFASAAERDQPRGNEDGISRGRYLVERVAMCVQCHTPRNQTGELLQTRYLQGAPVPVSAPSNFRIEWAYKAPAIAGLPGYTTEEGIKLLMEGVTRDGRTPKAPMPRFRLTRGDAEAIIAYLKSLS